MSRTGYHRRITYAPYVSGSLGFMVALMVGLATDSKLLFFISLVLGIILIYFIVTKIEDATDKVVDKAWDAVSNKITGRSEETSTFSNVTTTTMPKGKANPGPNEWRCLCGKINQNYAGQCSCGVRKAEAAKRIEESKKKAMEIAQKKNIPIPKEDSVIGKAEKTAVSKQFENEWRCVCGRVNPKFIGTCQCGMRKSEVIKRRAVALQKSKEIMEAKRAKEQMGIEEQGKGNSE